MSNELTAQEQDSLIQLARDKGLSVLAFLEKVMKGDWKALGEKKPIPVRERLAAADLLRKFASLPSNVNLELDTRKILVYEGDREIKPLPAATPVIDVPYNQSSASVLREES